jgi:hypothetical protein
MRRFLSLVGIVLLSIGLYQANELSGFLSRATPVLAIVTSVEVRPGPPKPTQNTPVHVRFTMPNGEEVAATTHMPLLRVVKDGDSISLLVDPTNPQVVKLPLISELWATPLAYLISGLVLVCAVLFLKIRGGDFNRTPKAR